MVTAAAAAGGATSTRTRTRRTTSCCSPTTACCTTTAVGACCACALLVSSNTINKIRNGEVGIEYNWLDRSMITEMRNDAIQLHNDGYFSPDGLTNTALGSSIQQQGFTSSVDRQTFQGSGWYDKTLGNIQIRNQFAMKMDQLRIELAQELNRPTLATIHDDDVLVGGGGGGEQEGHQQQVQRRIRRHEMTYNWYENGAYLGRHLDEHHEETKGIKGWIRPSRRSITWLVYLNEPTWNMNDGGILQTFPHRRRNNRNTRRNSEKQQQQRRDSVDVGCHEGNLQVGWLKPTPHHHHDGIRRRRSNDDDDDGYDDEPVFLDSFRESGQNALYTVVSSSSTAVDNDNDTRRRNYISMYDFDVPKQPIDFSIFLSKENHMQKRFQQISTARYDPRFVRSQMNNNNNSGSGSSTITTTAPPPATTTTTPIIMNYDNEYSLNIVPTSGTLVLFDSVTVPHLVQQVTTITSSNHHHNNHNNANNKNPKNKITQRIAATGWFHEDSPCLLL